MGGPGAAEHAGGLLLGESCQRVCRYIQPDRCNMSTGTRTAVISVYVPPCSSAALAAHCKDAVFLGRYMLRIKGKLCVCRPISPCHSGLIWQPPLLCIQGTARTVWRKNAFRRRQTRVTRLPGQKAFRMCRGSRMPCVAFPVIMWPLTATFGARSSYADCQHSPLPLPKPPGGSCYCPVR